MSEATIRYGIIGTGLMGLEHLRNLLDLPGASVVAICDPHPRSRELAHLTVGDRGSLVDFSDHRQLLAAGLCDAVVVATPNHTHRSVVGAVLRDGVHVLAEKPLGISAIECSELIAIADATQHDVPDRVVWMGMEYRFMPPIRALVERAHTGEAGVIRMVSIREHRFPFLDKVGHWNRFRRTTGGTLVEKCCHFFDLMHLIVGREPVAVMASGAQDVNHLDERYDGERPDMLDNAFVVVEFDGGARGVLELCMFAEGSVNEQEICVVGDLAKVEAFVSEGTMRVGRRASGARGVTSSVVQDQTIRHVGMHHGSSYLEHVGFLDAIRRGAAPAVTLADGRRAVVIGEAAHRSIDERRWVEVAEFAWSPSSAG